MTEQPASSIRVEQATRIAPVVDIEHRVERFLPLSDEKTTLFVRRMQKTFDSFGRVAGRVSARVNVIASEKR